MQFRYVNEKIHGKAFIRITFVLIMQVCYNDDIQIPYDLNELNVTFAYREQQTQAVPRQMKAHDVLWLYSNPSSSRFLHLRYPRF